MLFRSGKQLFDDEAFANLKKLPKSEVKYDYGDDDDDDDD